MPFSANAHWLFAINAINNNVVWFFHVYLHFRSKMSKLSIETSLRTFSTCRKAKREIIMIDKNDVESVKFNFTELHNLGQLVKDDLRQHLCFCSFRLKKEKLLRHMSCKHFFSLNTKKQNSSRQLLWLFLFSSSVTVPLQWRYTRFIPFEFIFNWEISFLLTIKSIKLTAKLLKSDI